MTDSYDSVASLEDVDAYYPDIITELDVNMHVSRTCMSLTCMLVGGSALLADLIIDTMSIAHEMLFK